MESKNRITLKDLQKILYDDKSKRRIRAVQSPNAQYSKLLHVEPNHINQLTSIIQAIYRSPDQPTFLKAVIELQYLYGLRISEVLNIDKSDILPSGNIRIKGAKRSNDRIVTPSRYMDFWLNATSLFLPICRLYSRFWFYRKFKELGLYSKYGSNINNSVTHSLRHEKVLELKSNLNDTKLSQSFIGHKSINSTVHYERKKKI